MEKLFFWVFAITTIVAAISTVTRKNPLHCALSLVVAFISLAGLYFLQNAPFVGVVQILVYAGAITVLVVFVIMFLNLPDTELEEERVSKIGMILSLFLLAPLAALAVGVVASEDPVMAEVDDSFGDVESVGTLMFDRYVLQFELISVLLLVAIVGTVVLAKKKL